MELKESFNLGRRYLPPYFLFCFWNELLFNGIYTKKCIDH